MALQIATLMDHLWGCDVTTKLFANLKWEWAIEWRSITREVGFYSPSEICTFIDLLGQWRHRSLFYFKSWVRLRKARRNIKKIYLSCFMIPSTHICFSPSLNSPFSLQVDKRFSGVITASDLVSIYNAMECPVIPYPIPTSAQQKDGQCLTLQRVPPVSPTINIKPRTLWLV